MYINNTFKWALCHCAVYPLNLYHVDLYCSYDIQGCICSLWREAMVESVPCYSCEWPLCGPYYQSFALSTLILPVSSVTNCRKMADCVVKSRVSFMSLCQVHDGCPPPSLPLCHDEPRVDWGKGLSDWVIYGHAEALWSGFCHTAVLFKGAGTIPTRVPKLITLNLLFGTCLWRSQLS